MWSRWLYLCRYRSQSLSGGLVLGHIQGSPSLLRQTSKYHILITRWYHTVIYHNYTTATSLHVNILCGVGGCTCAGTGLRASLVASFLATSRAVIPLYNNNRKNKNNINLKINDSKNNYSNMIQII